MVLFNKYIANKKKNFAPGNKIYLSLSSEGFGHSSRGLAIAREFPKNDIIIGTYNYALGRCRNAGYNCVELPQELKLIGEKGAFDVKKTIIKNHSWALTFNNIINKEIEAIRENGASCVIADGRLTPVMAAEKLSLPCVVITNQSAFYPFFERDSALIRVFGRSFDWIMKTWLSSAEEIMIPDFPPPYTVCLHNLSRNFKVMKRTRFVGPLVSFDPDNIEKIEKPAKNYIAVALGGHSYRKPLLDNVIETSKKLPDTHFDVFTSLDANNLPDNLKIHRSVSNIVPYLNAADLVISQAGHSTAMELLTLGKPSIIVPDFKQIEQENNARRMEELNVAVKLEYANLSPEKLVDAVKKIKSESVYQENVNKFKEFAKEFQGGKKVAEVIQDYSKRLHYY
ncbi:MAG TPA: glycosyltransferase [Candidatus Gastranaerophilales bacterium]|nr:glycosyltransferase [Candidatus Gastranaerophilales bacterium]